MKIESLKEEKNGLLKRKEVNVELTYKGVTPKREEIKKVVCEKIGANQDLSVLREVRTFYGSKTLKACVHVYEEKDQMKKVEAKYILKRDFPEKKEEKPKEEKKEDKPEPGKK